MKINSQNLPTTPAAPPRPPHFTTLPFSNVPIATLHFVILLFLLSGCMVKSTLKKGAAYESASMFKDASELYYSACLKKPDHPDLKIALKRAGQLYIDDQADNMAQAFNRGDYKTTVYTYMTAKDFIDRVSAIGTDLKQDPNMSRLFGDAKDSYLSQRYDDGQRNLTDQKFDEAKLIFAEICKIDPEYKDARNYLKTATYEPVYQDGVRLFGEGKYMDAYNRWYSIFSKDKGYRDIAEQMTQALNERYKQGSVSLMNENFQDAALALGEVYHADAGFKDVKQLYTEARNEPIYRQGNAFLTGGKCRTAWYSFDQIIKDAGVYKDASNLRDRALSCAQFPIAVTTTERRGYSPGTRQFQSLLVGQLISQKNIFLKIYDLADLEQRVILGLFSAGKPDMGFIQQVANRQNCKAILYVEFSTLERNEGKLTREEKTGFERTSSKNQYGQTVYDDKQVKYHECSQKNSFSATLIYRLVSTESGEILLSDRLSDTRSDEIHYIEYSGNKDILYPATGRFNNYTINADNKTVQSLLRSSRNITSIEKLIERVFTPMSQKIAVNINNFNPEK